MKTEERLEALFSSIEEVTGHKREVIMSRCRRQSVVMVRMIAELLLYEDGAFVDQMCHKFGHKEESCRQMIHIAMELSKSRSQDEYTQKFKAHYTEIKQAYENKKAVAN